MENVGDLAENEASLIHAASLNKKTGNVIPRSNASHAKIGSNPSFIGLVELSLGA